MESVSTLQYLLFNAKSKLEKPSHRVPLLKRTLLRLSYNSWRNQWSVLHGGPKKRRRFPRKDQNCKINRVSNGKTLYNPELLRVFDYLESLYDSDYSGPNDSDYYQSPQVSLPYIFRGNYHSLHPY